MKVLDYGAERKWQGLSALSVPLLPKPQLRLAAEPQAGGREVSAAKAARKTLAYDFFRFLYSPHIDQ